VVFITIRGYFTISPFSFHLIHKIQNTTKFSWAVLNLGKFVIIVTISDWLHTILQHALVVNGSENTGIGLLISGVFVIGYVFLREALSGVAILLTSLPLMASWYILEKGG
jgi:hypothetical protein